MKSYFIRPDAAGDVGVSHVPGHVHAGAAGPAGGGGADVDAAAHRERPLH